MFLNRLPYVITMPGKWDQVSFKGKGRGKLGNFQFRNISLHYHSIMETPV